MVGASAQPLENPVVVGSIESPDGASSKNMERTAEPLPMDALDHSLVSCLEQAGSLNATTAAQVLGISYRSARRRIDNLIDIGAIRLVAVPNPVACGFGAWTKIGIRVLPEYLQGVSRGLVEHRSVYFAAHSLGRFDIIIAALFESNRELAHFINTDLAMIEGIVDVEPWMMVIPRKYYQFSWPAPVFELNGNWWSPYREVSSPDQCQRIDERYRRILSVLRENALVRPSVLAARVDMGESTLRKYLGEMKRKNLFRLNVVPNPQILRGEVWATVGIKALRSRVYEVTDAVSRDASVYLCTVTLGRFDIIASARFAGNAELNRFATCVLPSIKGITSVETFVHYKPLKYHSIHWSGLDPQDGPHGIDDQHRAV